MQKRNRTTLIETEVSYKDKKEVGRGEPGSIRVDALEGTPDAPTAVYDLKTGGAKLTPKREAEIRGHLPENAKNIPIREVRPE